MVTGLAAVKRVHFGRLRSIEVGNWLGERVLLRKREIAESKMAALQLRAFLYYYVEPRFLKSGNKWKICFRKYS